MRTDGSCRSRPWLDVARELARRAHELFKADPELLAEFRELASRWPEEWADAVALEVFRYKPERAAVLARTIGAHPRAIEHVMRALPGGWDATGRQSETLDEVCYHEAGHAVVAWHFGMPVAEITRNGSNGEALVDHADESELGGLDEARARAELLVAQAGAAAQCRFLGIQSGWLGGSCGGDMKWAHLVCVPRGWEMSDFGDVDQLLDRDRIWSRVSALATALTGTSKIDAGAFLQLMCEPGA